MLLLSLQLIHVVLSPLIMHFDQCLSFIGTARERESERERESINLVNKKRGHMSLRELKVDREREKESERVRDRET